MTWEIAVAIATILAFVGSIIGIIIYCGKLLQKIEDTIEEVKENKEKSIESDKLQNDKIEENKNLIEQKLKEELSNLESSILKKIEDNENKTESNKADLEAFRYEVTTRLLVVLKENMTDLVNAELNRLRETDISYLAETIDDNRDTIEEKIEKLEKKIENIEYKDIMPIREAIAELKQKLRDQ